jgi:hypothetical protein
MLVPSSRAGQLGESFGLRTASGDQRSERRRSIVDKYIISPLKGIGQRGGGMPSAINHQGLRQTSTAPFSQADREPGARRDDIVNLAL